MALNGKITLAADFVQTAANDMEAGKSELHVNLLQQYADGAGAGQANVMFSDRRSLAAATSEDLDLAGALTALLGSAVFARVKAIIIKSADANPSNGVIRVTRTASVGVPFPNITASDSIFPDIGPGGFRAMIEGTAAGVAVTATTADKITVENTSADTEASYDIIVIGAAT